MNTVESLETLLWMATECTKECVDDPEDILNNLCYHATEFKAALEEAIKLVKEQVPHA